MKLTLLFVFISLTAFGQENISFRHDTSSLYKEFQEYERELMKKLTRGLNPDPLLQYFVAPAFGAEGIMNLEKENGEFFLIYQVFDRSYWYNKERSKIGLNTFRKHIPEDYVLSLIKLFTLAMDSRDHSHPIGMDGIRYNFSLHTDGHVVEKGTAWSPREGTRVYQLKEICNRYIEILQESKKFTNQLLVDTRAVIALYE